MTVDAKLEIESCRASGGYPNRSQGRATLHVSAFFDRYILEISVQTEVLAAVIDDHQAAETRKDVRIGDRAIVDDPYRQAFGAGDVNPVVHAATGVGNPKPLS